MKNTPINITTTEIDAISQLSILFKEEPSCIAVSPEVFVVWEGNFGEVRLCLGEQKIQTFTFEPTEPLMWHTLLGIITHGSFTHDEF
jgi:hypothetical protein